MADSSIEWTDKVWNPMAGCSILSPGCTNCYAMRMAARIERMNPGLKYYRGLTKQTKAGPVWTGHVSLAPDHKVTEPLRWRKPQMVFVNSMSDLFHEAVPDERIDRVFAVMALAPQHRFQVLTKRTARMHAYMEERWQPAPAMRVAGLSIPAETVGEGRRSQIERACEPLLEAFGLADTSKDHLWTEDDSCKAMQWSWPLPNVWLGTSVERQQEADERRAPLAALAAAGWNTWVSYEPALGPVDWSGWEFIRWFVGGGESGPKARPTDPIWHRASRDFCIAHNIPYFFKQWGAWDADALRFTDMAGRCPPPIMKVGKKRAGALLDGVAWRQLPEPRP